MNANTPTYLIKLGIGSVQRFVGAARRSRDLWSGSQFIAEVIKAAARNLHELDCQGEIPVTLIFPAPEDPDLDLASGSPFQPSNVILAKVETDDPAKVVNDALRRAHEQWQALTDEALSDLQSRLRHSAIDVNEETWRAQAEDALELFGVWLPWQNPEQELPPLSELDALYSARKRTRTFRAHPLAELNHDKSSLDARGESVLAGSGRLTPRLRYRLGLNSTEQLDCSGWTKRLGVQLDGYRRTFTPLIRVALDPWLRALAETDEIRPILDKLKADCNKLVRYRSYDAHQCWPIPIISIRRRVNAVNAVASRTAGYERSSIESRFAATQVFPGSLQQARKGD